MHVKAMYHGKGVGGRTRNREALTEKQCSERNSKRRKRNQGEELASHYAREEGYSMDSGFDDDDLTFIEEGDVANTLNDNGVLLIKDGDEETISDDDALSDDDNEKAVISTSSRCIAKRTRSHFPVSKFRNSKLGTFSNPLSVDDDDEENDSSKIPQQSLHGEGEVLLEKYTFSSDDEGNPKVTRKQRTKYFDAVKIHEESLRGAKETPLENLASSSDEEGNAKVTRNQRTECFDAVKIHGESLRGEKEMPLENFTSSSDEEGNPKVTKKQKTKYFDSVKIHEQSVRSEEEMPLENFVSSSDEEGNPKVTNKRRKKNSDAIKILEESLRCEEEMPLENFSSSSDEQGNPKATKTCLPSKSPFGTKVSQPPEKSEADKEMDILWGEMYDSLRASTDQAELGHEDEVSKASLCDHLLMKDEEIGLVCKKCLFVSRDIKDCDPPFCKNPWGNSARRVSYSLENADHPVFEDLPHQIFDSDDESSGIDHYSSTGTVWDKIPGVRKSMFNHQREAFEFLWTNLVGETVLDNLKEHLDFASGSGCIISHAPGTGKTFLTIVFLLAFMRVYPNCKPMIIAPSPILHTWEEELKKWKVGVPFHNLNKSEYSGLESKVALNLVRLHSHRLRNTRTKRLVKLYSWKNVKSILGISYNLFSGLAGKSSDDTIKKALLELPGLLVLDEGHTPRNKRSSIWKALSKIKTKRRIILSGTPFQNNLVELFNTLCLAKPNFAKSKPPGDMVVVDEKQGYRRSEAVQSLAYLIKSYDKVESSSEKDKVIAEIRDMIKPFVHVHKGTVLQKNLPGLREFVVRLKPSEMQKEIFECIQVKRKTQLQNEDGSSIGFKLEHLESLAAVHPSLLTLAENENLLERIRLNPDDGVKTIFLMELIQLSKHMKEKVLVFSQYIIPLNFLMHQIKSQFNWIEGEQILLLHGKTDEETRQASINAFNDPTSKVRVMLASVKACFEGIHLIGASRVVLLDTLWNPSTERQAVCRAYRIGQKKVVYSYRLITSGSRDEQKCGRQAEKDLLSKSVFHCPSGACHHQNISSVAFQDEILEKMARNGKLAHIFENITTNGGVSFLLEGAE